MKAFWIFILSLAAGSSYAIDCEVHVPKVSIAQVLYVNGIKNTKLQAMDTKSTLAAILSRDGFGPSRIEASLFYNPGSKALVGAGLIDLDEVRSQLTVVESALFKNPDGSAENYYAGLGQEYENLIRRAPASEIAKTTVGLYCQLLDYTETSKKPVVIVAHSQGTLYAEAAYALLWNQGRADILNRIRVVDIASLAYARPDGGYITLDQDEAIRSGDIVSGLSLYRPLPPTNIACVDIEAVCYTSHLLIKTMVGTGTLLHIFDRVYLEPSVRDVVTHRSIQELVASKVEAAVLDIERPKFRNVLLDNFSGDNLDVSKWSPLSCGTELPAIDAGHIHLGPCAQANTKGKVQFGASKIVLEARLIGPKESGRDTAISLVDVTTGDRIQIGDTNYKGMSESGFGVYVLGTGVFNREQGPSPLPSTNQWKAYRVTFDGPSVTVQRGDSLDALSETYTVSLPSSIAGHTFYLKLSTGAADGTYSPGEFDWIRVKTF